MPLSPKPTWGWGVRSQADRLSSSSGPLQPWLYCEFTPCDLVEVTCSTWAWFLHSLNEGTGCQDFWYLVHCSESIALSCLSLCLPTSLSFTVWSPPYPLCISVCIIFLCHFPVPPISVPNSLSPSQSPSLPLFLTFHYGPL